MRSSVIVFPGSNCDRDIAVALEKMKFKNQMVWHKESELPKSDLIVIPGGFSYGDYLRSGAIAAKSNILAEVIDAGKKGALILGICNGFQILIECGLLKGALLRNSGLKFISKDNIENRINGDPNLWLLMVELGLVRPAGYQYGNPENGVVNNEFEYGYGLYTLLSLVPGLGETLEFISFTVPEYLMDIWNEITGGDPNWEPPVPGGYQGPITPPTYSPTQPTRQP